MGKLYGFGAAIVIVGALFKLMHWQGAGVMLTLGMSIEAIIFVFSAFDPPPHETDWTIVFPELGKGHAAEAAENSNEEGGSSSSRRKKGGATSDSNLAVAAAADAATIDLSSIDTKKLADGINKLGQTANELSDLSVTVAAASVLSEKIQQASTSVASFSDFYEQSSQVLSESVNILSGSYQKAAETVLASSKQAGDKIIDSTKQVARAAESAADSFAATFTSIDQQVKITLDELKHGNAGYSKHLESLNKNITALNTVYEIQAHEAVKYQKNSVEMGKQLESFVTDLHKSAEENQAFRKGIAHLNENIVELNSIYGNMLSAVHSATTKKK